MKLILNIFVFIAFSAHAQLNFELNKVDSVFFQIEYPKNHAFTSMSLIDSLAYLMLGDSSGYYLINLKAKTVNTKILPSKLKFLPYSVENYGNSKYFMNYDNNKVLIQNQSSDFQVIELDRIKSGHWIGAQSGTKPICVKDDQLYISSRGGAVNESKLKKSWKFYKRTKTISQFDLSGKLIAQFGSFDSLYQTQIGMSWAKTVYNYYSSVTDRFYTSSYVSPLIQAYNSQHELIKEFGYQPESYTGQIPKVIGTKDSYISGLRHHIEIMNFMQIFEDHSNQLLFRMYYPALADTSKLDQTYVNLILNPEEKQIGCTIPNPILKDQFEILQSKPLYLQVYSSSSLEYLGSIATAMDWSYIYLGQDNEGLHLFWQRDDNGIAISKWQVERL